MLLRKFLNHDNHDDPVIYDETRTDEGGKQNQRNMDLPSEMQVINSSGERLNDDVFGDDDDDIVEIVQSPTVTGDATKEDWSYCVVRFFLIHDIFQTAWHTHIYTLSLDLK